MVAKTDSNGENCGQIQTIKSLGDQIQTIRSTGDQKQTIRSAGDIESPNNKTSGINDSNGDIMINMNEKVAKINDSNGDKKIKEVVNINSDKSDIKDSNGESCNSGEINDSFEIDKKVTVEVSDGGVVSRMDNKESNSYATWLNREQRHLHSVKQIEVKPKCNNDDVCSNLLDNSKSTVKDKIKVFENKKVQRSLIKLSPIKERNKLRSERMKSKINDVNKMHKADVNENKSMSMDKIMSKGKIYKMKLSMISDTLKENVHLKNEMPNESDDRTALEVDDCSELKNAFKLMLESRKGAFSPSNTPRRKYMRKKIGEFKPSPSRLHKRNGTITDWLKMNEK